MKVQEIVLDRIHEGCLGLFIPIDTWHFSFFSLLPALRLEVANPATCGAFLNVSSSSGKASLIQQAILSGSEKCEQKARWVHEETCNLTNGRMAAQCPSQCY